MTEPLCQTCRFVDRDKREYALGLDEDLGELGGVKFEDRDFYTCKHPSTGAGLVLGFVANGKVPIECNLYEIGAKKKASFSAELEARLKASAERAERDEKRGQ